MENYLPTNWYKLFRGKSIRILVKHIPNKRFFFREFDDDLIQYAIWN